MGSRGQATIALHSAHAQTPPASNVWCHDIAPNGVPASRHADGLFVSREGQQRGDFI